MSDDEANCCIDAAEGGAHCRLDERPRYSADEATALKAVDSGTPVSTRGCERRGDRDNLRRRRPRRTLHHRRLLRRPLGLLLLDGLLELIRRT